MLRMFSLFQSYSLTASISIRSRVCKHCLHLQLLLLQGHLLLHQLHLDLHLLRGHVARVDRLHRLLHHGRLALWCHHHGLSVRRHHWLLLHILASHEWHARLLRMESSNVGNCLILRHFDGCVALHALHHLLLVHLLLFFEELLLILVRRCQLALDEGKVRACQLHLLLGSLDALELDPGILGEAVLAAHLQQPLAVHPEVDQHVDGQCEVDPVERVNSSLIAHILLPD